MERVKFYNENDLSCGWSIERIIELLNNLKSDNTDNLIDIMEYHNTLKFCDITRFLEIIANETGIEAKIIKQTLNTRIGKFIGQNKMNYIHLYADIDFMYEVDYFELIDKYKIYENISEVDFEQVIIANQDILSYILKNEKITKHFDLLLCKSLKSEPKNTEMVLSAYLKETTLYLPDSFSRNDVEQLMIEYIESDSVNMNYLKKIFHFPSNNQLIIRDKIKLMAQRRYDQKLTEIFNGNNGIYNEIKIVYTEEQEDAFVAKETGLTTEINIRRDWIFSNLDYNTLWNNFIHLFGFFDTQIRLSLVSKNNDIGTLERITIEDKDYLYKLSASFRFLASLSHVFLLSYSEILNTKDIRIEEMIEWFFKEYLSDEFGVENFIVNVPSENSAIFEKCRAILPEIDRILKQYGLYIEDGKIDQELLQISSTHLLFSECRSLVRNKYVYPNSQFFNQATFLLFSNQSPIFHLEKLEKNFENFFDLIVHEELKFDDFQNHQIEGIKWLIENDLLIEDEKGFLNFPNMKKIHLLKDLFYNEVISFWHHSKEVRNEIKKLIDEDILHFESTLFSKSEQDYLNFHLNKAKFSNSLDLRNRYLHGTHTNNINQHKNDYLIFLKVIIIIVVKINDDLCLKDKIDKLELE